ncbi:MAG: L,D-transpeptidase [Bdellovibrionaceae bacterium]|nr:L,D-transpeptidase [Pseudobdellovibrionaceae bacterium]
MNARRTLASARLIVLIGLVAVTSMSCSQPDSGSSAPHTGDLSIEAQVAPEGTRPLAPETAPSATAPGTSRRTTAPTRPSPSRATTPTGTTLYIYSERVRARSSAEITEGNISGVLEINDRVTIVDSKQIGPEKFVQVQVIQSGSLPAGTIVFVSAKYLSTQQRTLTNDEKANLRYFIVQNIATERIRVYERCEDGAECLNKLVFEAEMVAGEDDDGTRTNVGHYKIQRWEKFYEDGARKYPAWYRPHYPAVPGPGSRTAWLSKDVMPDGKGDMRGAFGWYTAIVGPNANAQWTHGTVGWGEDGDDFITFRREFAGWIVNLFTAIRSHGCSRVDNEAISYLRHLVPKGSTMVKIYAREGLRDVERKSYSQDKPSWNYILTKTGYGKDMGQTADAASVLASGTPESEYLDRGRYKIDQYPDIASGNVYDLSDRQFSGVFVIDEGTVVDYRHPSDLNRGGFSDQMLPSYMISTDSAVHTKPAAETRPSDPFDGGTYTP